MRILITGFSGFVCKHFLDYINMAEPSSFIMGIDRNEPQFDIYKYDSLNINFKKIDLLDKSTVDKIFTSFNPNYILHLASVSSVAQSWQAPLDCFENNTKIFVNILEYIRNKNNTCRILSVGSSEEYGAVLDDELPLTEHHSLKPTSPYAVARISQEMLSILYSEGYSLDIVMTRSFNHIGPGQKDTFVISSFAKQLVMLNKNKSDGNEIVTGDTSIIRDFTDVRDVVKAYYLLLKKGRKGEIYNICSGDGISLQEVLFKMCGLLNMSIVTIINPLLIRQHENKKVIGSYKKIREELGWQPQISIEKSLLDIINYWKDS